jgi:hypothetical protein
MQNSTTSKKQADSYLILFSKKRSQYELRADFNPKFPRAWLVQVR